MLAAEYSAWCSTNLSSSTTLIVLFSILNITPSKLLQLFSRFIVYLASSECIKAIRLTLDYRTRTSTVTLHNIHQMSGTLSG